jgi:ArsR family metal-binding transcriptional regulator
MAVYNLLPKTNCKKCGQPTCFTFGLKLAASQVRVEDCPPLFEPENAENLAALQAIIIDAPSIN